VQADAGLQRAEPGEFIFTFGNTRDAVEGEKKLLGAGLSPGVMPLPDQIGAGCGICLRVSPGDLEKARSVLEGSFQGIYGIYPPEPPVAEGSSPKTGTGGNKKVFIPWNL
jgi:hypothetical protein